MESRRWGVRGAGWIAPTFARDLSHAYDGVVLSVGVRTQKSADQFDEAFDIPRRRGSYAALVVDPDVEAVHVVTPLSPHAEHARMALEHGNHVPVDKTLTMNADEPRSVVAVSRSRNHVATEAMWTRFFAHVVTLRDLWADGVLDTVVMLHADHGSWFEREPTSRLFAPELGGRTT